MKTVSVVYVGQARYLECLEYHKSIIKGYSNLYACLSTDLVELWRLPSKVTHSINGNLTKAEIINKLTSIQSFNNVKILNDNDYETFDHTGIDFYPCAYLYSLFKSLDNIDTDFAVFLTTDLIFSKQESVMPDIQSLAFDNSPKAYVQFLPNQPNMIKPFFICINREGIRKIKRNFINSLEQYLNSSFENKLKNEYATYKLLSDCGLTIEKLSLKYHVKRFRPNMNLNDVINFDFLTMENLSREYSLDKLDRNNKRNGKRKIK